ncbi:NAD(P)-binding protein [Microthyrium microscopicum]|uniref:NAD(P)-binding protein n=1 Tax=Microthyrium microscopicum TaxID=703497 RepID=A0A6A6UF74_9PEZI|nr:NAD(P)-binding protein [Microthyrium microscopicum]
MSLSFFAGWVKGQWTFTPPVPTTTYTGQTVIVTGANIGLGLEAARHIVNLDAARVILAVRTLKKGETAKTDIEATTGRKGVVEVWQLDLSSYASVKEFAAKASKLDRLDILLENAGIATEKFTLLEDNESTITVNVVSTYLLALLLLPILKSTAATTGKKSYLTIVSSEMHFMTQAPYLTSLPPTTSIFATLNDPNAKYQSDRYQLSKLLEVFASRQMVDDYMSNPDYPVITNFLTPGLCKSELMREAGLKGTIVKTAFGARTTEVGSRTLVHATQAGQDSHGRFLMNCQIRDVAPLVESEKGVVLQRRVWEELSAKLEKIQPGILKNF